MNAPRLKRSGYNTKANTLDAAYAAWGAHYNACRVCQHEDWYSPDEELLCPVGLVLFSNWNRASIKYY